MYVRVDEGVGLEDVDNFRAFAVVAVGERDLGAALREVGTVDGEHVWVEPEAVKRLAGERATPEWAHGFEQMIEFARSKGWVDGQGRVRAHIERP